MQTQTTLGRRRPLATALLCALLLPGTALAETKKEQELEARIAQLDSFLGSHEVCFARIGASAAATIVPTVLASTGGMTGARSAAITPRPTSGGTNSPSRSRAR